MRKAVSSSEKRNDSHPYAFKNAPLGASASQSFECKELDLQGYAIKALRISLASPEQIRAWSYGEIFKAETINYRTLKPETDGLLCERIFGPTKDWTCACGKYKRQKHRGKVCEKCGVEIGPSRVRRVRMGHIELAAPVCHPWYMHGMPGKLSLLLDLAQRDLESVIACARYLVVSIDEAAWLSELQRIQTEIDQIERASDEKPAQRAKTVPLVRPVRAAHVRDEARGDESWVAQVQEEERATARVAHTIDGRSLSPTDLPSILQDLKAFADARRGEVFEDELEQRATLSGPAILHDLQAFARMSREGSAEEALEEPDGNDEAILEEFELSSLDRRERLAHLRRTQTLLAQLVPRMPLEIEAYRLLTRECPGVLRGGTGAEVIETLLKTLDLAQMASELREEIAGGDEGARSKATKRLKVVEALRRSGARPEWMVLRVIPVLPPDLRPVLVLDGGRFAASDLNELYSRIIHRNNRLKHFLEIDAPDLMILREKQALQQACDALFDNSHSARPAPGPGGKPLRSLTDALSGKDGIFRHNLLGKRVDYSGRSVISVGLELKLHQCGLPKKIALELFKPFLVQKLVAYGYFATPRQAKRAVERHEPKVWDVLDEVMSTRVVLLNRAPTLHRLSIQAFEPVLVEGNAIRLHPQVCSAFNADFDGDQMAVHLPLTEEAQREARALMFSTRNMLSPASGEPAISITQEQVLGCFYLTQERPGKQGEGRLFSDIHDALQAYQHGIIDLQAPIFVRLNVETIYDQPPPALARQSEEEERVHTTVGRLLFNQVLPRRLGFRNYAMKKDLLKQLVWDGITLCGMERTAVMANEIKRLGFNHATKAAISFSTISDVAVPPQKKEILAQADSRVASLQDEWRAGLITREELYEQSVALWSEATDQVAQHVQEVLDPYGSITTIATSGATKAKLQQIRQLSGMRGLMASPSGAIIETPVRGNFLEGLSVAEYFLSSHGARKSMMDRSLNTAQSGYLTIQLVNAAQEVIVTEEDCGTAESLLVSEEDSRSMGLSDNASRLIGRVLAEELPGAGLATGEALDEAAIACILAARISSVRVRSVLACQSRQGVCRRCYGWDLSRRALVELGTAVGIIAAQSIGEPGTQLTMRTFHSGGIAGGQGDITQGIPRVKELFEARAPKVQAIASEIAGVVSVTKDGQSSGYRVHVVGEAIERSYHIPPGRKPIVETGQHVRAYDPLTAGGRDPHDILRYQGRRKLELYLLKEAQLVYRTTGAYIHDKHFEVVLRQMLRYVQIETPGDSEFLPDDLVDRFAYADSNARTVAQGGEAATGRPVLLGLVRTALATQGWLAAASFQQTSRVLTEAALEGRVDHLRGLKENVILGKMIPAGTGLLAREQQAARPAPRRRGRPPKQR